MCSDCKQANILPEFESLFHEYEAEGALNANKFSKRSYDYSNWVKMFESYSSPYREIDNEFEDGGLDKEKIIWVQSSLNRFTGITIKVDGIVGTDTIKSLKIFQQKYGINVTGVADANTIEMLTRSRIDYHLNFTTLCGVGYFDFNKFKHNDWTATKVVIIADILTKLMNHPGVLRLQLVGYADQSGSEKYNKLLAMNRALEVEKMLRCVLNRLKPGRGDPKKLPIEVGSFGERFSVRGEGQWSRHVEVNIQWKDDHYTKLKQNFIDCYQ